MQNVHFALVCKRFTLLSLYTRIFFVQNMHKILFLAQTRLLIVKKIGFDKIFNNCYFKDGYERGFFDL